MRSTQTLTTPSGKGLVIRDYLTAREKRELGLTFKKHMKVRLDTETGKPTMEGYDVAEAQRDEEESLIRFAVESYDGSPERITDRLLDEDTTGKDYDFVLAEAQKLRQIPKA